MTFLLGYGFVQPTFAETMPAINGVFVRGDWGNPVATQFFKFAPSEEGQPSGKTAFYIRQDSKALYFAFRCENAPGVVTWAPLTKRDQAMHGPSPSDGVLVYIDSTGEGRYQYFFGVNPRGVQEDGISQDQEDTSWDGVWESAASMDAEGYTIEMRIPFSILRFAPGRNRWYVMAGRIIASRGEFDTYPRQSRNVVDFTKQAMAINVNPGGPYGERAFMPFVAAQGNRSTNGSKGGADLVMPGPGHSVFNLTANPDFGQAEADVPQFDVNNRFPLFYPEKRPFFIEHSELFTGLPITAFYSRQVIDPVMGARLSGELGASHYTGLYVREQPESDVYGSARASDFVLRSTSDLYASSYLGGTLLYRDEEGGNRNAVGGIDGKLRFGDRWSLSFAALGDEDEYGGKATRGFAVETCLGYSSKTLGFSFNPFTYSKDFLDRLGYVQRNDFSGVASTVSYTLWLNKPWLVSVTPSLRTVWAEDHTEVVTDRKTVGGLSFDFGNNNSLTVQATRYMERWQGADYDKKDLLLSGSLWSNQWVKVSADYFVGDAIFYAGNRLANERRPDATVSLSPAPWLRIDLVGAKDRLEDRGGALIYDVYLAYARAEWTLSTTTFLRGTLTKSSSDEQTYSNLLFGYIAKPGSVVYVGLTREKNPALGIPTSVTKGYLKVGYRLDW